MSRTLFENSKAALAFAGMTLIGAVTMVGTSEKGGVLSRVDDIVANQRANIASDAQAFAASQSVGDQPSSANSPWGKPVSVFGDYDPAQASQPATASAPAAAQGNGPMNAPLAPGAVIDDGSDPDAAGVAVITDREMTIEPQ
jgi:hypothetical protein